VGVELTEPAPAVAPGATPVRRRADPGTVLALASTAPALLVGTWLLVAYPLALRGHATPLVALPPFLLVAVGVLAATRRLPAVAGTPWWSVLATGAVAAGFTAFTAAHAAGHVVLRRDSAVYALLARWLADTGGLRIPAHVDLIGAPDAVVGTKAPGLYPAGEALTAQFMSGTALTLAPAGWGSAGWGAILLGPALLGGCALLAFAGLAARLVGPRWAPVAALALGLTQPMLLTFRATYSEPLAQLLLLAALALLLDAVGTRSRPLGALAGLLVGLGLLVRIDAVRDLALLVPVLAWLAYRRNPAWLPAALGAALGVLYGVADAAGPAHAYVSDLSSLVRKAAYGGVLLVAVAAVAVPVARRRRPRPVPRWAPPAAGALTGLVLLGLATRPLWLEGHGAGQATWRFIESMQREQGLPVDGRRSYAERTLEWVGWYVGLPVLVLAAVAAVLLAAAAVAGRGDGVRGPARRWVLGLGLPLLSAVSVLLDPAITPDHPWADRRLVPTVLPVVVLLAVWAVAAAARWAAGRASAGAAGAGTAGAGADAAGAGRRAVGPAVLAVGLAVLLVPAVLGSRALAFSRTEQGEPAAVERACAAFAPGEVALLVDARARQEWTAPLREACGVPAFAVPGDGSDDLATPAQVADAAARVRRAGGTPVLVAQSGDPLPRLTGAPQRQVVDLDTEEHDRQLARPSDTLVPLSVELWRADPDQPLS
jgi:hypothetical protein